ncbi:CatB-related O-acetyltransferase [Mucilaginibacter sp.]|jgi:acetyltransferase-like isoleucine patch superfamily enzyme|uniref:CatB-related O-acetyltransferase n=1 Tax=Mucilaginibacter sp. TaxID=1882438 RepID=UPI003569A8B8
MKTWLKRNYYRLAYYRKNVKIGKNVLLNTQNEFKGFNAIGNDTIFASSSIGLGSYIADRSVITKAVIGKFCSIGSFVQTGLGVHPSTGFVSSHPAFYSTQKQAGFSFVDKDIFKEHLFIDANEKYVVLIGNDVWIGNNVIIMDGIKIGDGAIIASGSIVTKDIAPYTIVGGVPAKFIKPRFDEQQAEKLLAIKWWDWSLEKIKTNGKFFENVEFFTSTFK